MHYMVSIRHRGEAFYLHDSILPGVVPDHVLDLMLASCCEDLGLCRDCEIAYRCHVLRHRPDLETPAFREVYDHLCPILFWDAVKPSSWRLADLT